MKKTTTFLLILTLAIANFAGISAEVAAASEDRRPYCSQTGYSNGQMLITYWSFKGNDTFASENESRKIFIEQNGSLKLGKKHTIIEKNAARIYSPVAWTKDGKKLVWINRDNEVLSAKFVDGKISNKKQIAAEAQEFLLNAERFVNKVVFKNGKTKTIKQLLDGDTAGTTSSTTSTTSSNDGKLKVDEDIAGRTIVKWDNNRIMSNPPDVYLNDILISELCDNFVDYFGVDKARGKIYLQEGDKNSFYEFDLKNIFLPKKMKIKTGRKIEGPIKDDNGFMIGIKTDDNKEFYPEQYAYVKTWYPKHSYAMNKYADRYVKYYLEGTHTVYTAELDGSELYLDGEKITGGIKRRDNSYGFGGKYLYYIKNAKLHRVNLKNTKKDKIIKKGVHKLTYKKYGLVKGAKK